MMATLEGPHRPFQGASFKAVAYDDTRTKVDGHARVGMTAARYVPQISLGATISCGPGSGETKNIFIWFLPRNDFYGMNLGDAPLFYSRLARCFPKRHESGTHIARGHKPTKKTETFCEAKNVSCPTPAEISLQYEV